MRKLFLLKSGKGKKFDFGFTEPSEFLFFYSPTLKDLRATLRCVTAQGYRVPKEQTLSKRIKERNGHLIALNPFFQTTMHEILEIESPVEIKMEVNYKNSFGFEHKLKLVDSALAENIWKLQNLKNEL